MVTPSPPPPPPPSSPSPPAAALWAVRLLAGAFGVLGGWMVLRGEVAITTRAWEMHPDGTGEIPVVLHFSGVSLYLLAAAAAGFGLSLGMTLSHPSRGALLLLVAAILMFSAFGVALA